MCAICGCDSPHGHADDNEHGHSHGDTRGRSHAHDHESGGSHHHYGHGSARVSVAGFTQDRLIEIEQKILSKNDRYADANRLWLAERETLALNLMSSPGAGKTTLLVETIRLLREIIPAAVIEGDQETANDAEKIRAAGAPAIQINTGKGCHLDAHMVGHGLDDLKLSPRGVVFIENVGNLVCPAMFDLGEDAKVVILSVTEGEDKPAKYPEMFAVADLMIVSKIDLCPHLDFDTEKAVAFARQTNPDIDVHCVSAKSGAGMETWINWIVSRFATHRNSASSTTHEEGGLARA